MQINIPVFLENAQSIAVNGKFTPSQIEGFERHIKGWTEHPAGGDYRFLAYALATVWHETGHKMQPVKEMGGDAYFKRMYDIFGERRNVAEDLGNKFAGDGVKFAGKGDVQITGRKNYEKFGKLLGIDLVNKPSLALDPDISLKIAIEGMTRGMFTGLRLSRYISSHKKDYLGARRVINSTDKASLIAGYALLFEGALIAAGATEKEVKPKPLVKSRTIQGTVGTGIGGAAVIASSIKEIQPQIESAQSQISAGSWLGLLCGVLILVCAGYAFYARWDDGERQNVKEMLGVE